VPPSALPEVRADSRWGLGLPGLQEIGFGKKGCGVMEDRFRIERASRELYSRELEWLARGGEVRLVCWHKKPRETVEGYGLCKVCEDVRDEIEQIENERIKRRANMTDNDLLKIFEDVNRQGAEEFGPIWLRVNGAIIDECECFGIDNDRLEFSSGHHVSAMMASIALAVLRLSREAERAFDVDVDVENIQRLDDLKEENRRREFWRKGERSDD